MFLITLGFILSVACAFLFGVIQKCQAFEISVTPVHYILQAENYGQSEGFLLGLGGDLKVSLSYEGIIGRFVGQEAVKIDLYGLQVAKKFSLINGFSLETGLGYYMPKWQETKAFREAMWLEVNGIYGDHSYFDPDHYEYRLFANIGGFVNLEYEGSIWKNLSVRGIAGYRFLNLHENIRRIQPQSNSYVEFGRDRDFSGGFVGLGLEWRF